MDLPGAHVSRTVACIVVASALGLIPVLMGIGVALGWLAANLVEAGL